MWQTSDHNKALELIIREPMLVGVEGVVDWSQVEFPFYNNRGTLLGQVDVLLHKKEGGVLYEVEFKCHDSTKQRLKAKEQLLIGRKGLKDQYGFVVAHMLYVHDRFIVEELLDQFVLLDDNREFVEEFQKRLDQGYGGGRI